MTDALLIPFLAGPEQSADRFRWTFVGDGDKASAVFQFLNYFFRQGIHFPIAGFVQTQVYLPVVPHLFDEPIDLLRFF